MNTAASPHRYAIYYLPQPHTQLYSLGVGWLGFDLERRVPIAPRLPAEISPDRWLEATASPRRYGFHATLKPPFRLAPNQAHEELRAKLVEFASNCKPFSGKPLKLARLGKFQALILTEPLEQLSQLAANCVTEFDCFRMPATEDELRKRHHEGLTEGEVELLQRWGYPYVLDTWKFHMTLTSSLSAPLSDLIYAHLDARLEPLQAEPLVVDSICLFEEPAAGEAFALVERFPFQS